MSQQKPLRHKREASDSVGQSYMGARQAYADYGVDTDAAMKALAGIALSMHCWQGDDVGGFERGSSLDGGLIATGNYPGKARTAEELRADADKAFSLIPGSHRFNLHAIYAETRGRRVNRDELLPEHFSAWTAWARGKKIGLDFNPTFFSHPLAADGLTLTSSNTKARKFWIEHGKRCRRIAAWMGRALQNRCICNVWIPDGSKDTPFDRAGKRERLRDALDEIFAERLDGRFMRDSVESKLFGIGSESFVAGSHEFYAAYAITRKKMLCLDSGHFHPTESIADKISALLLFLDGLLLHISRGIRWDSDHVAILTDETQAIAAEVVRGGFVPKTSIALDYFDASVNRLAAWVAGMRATQKALLIALLEPRAMLAKAENGGDVTRRMVLFEEAKVCPWQAVWNYFCRVQDVPGEHAWFAEVKEYERSVLSRRG